jgi:tetratricopeptide (TPR) repeat protein
VSRYQEAREALEKALALDSENLDALLYLGMLDLAQSAPERARIWFEKILNLRPGHPEAQYYLGYIYFTERKFEKALPLFQSVVQQVPDHLKAYYQLALTYSRLNQPDRAQEALQTFERLEALQRSRGTRSNPNAGPVCKMPHIWNKGYSDPVGLLPRSHGKEPQTVALPASIRLRTSAAPLSFAFSLRAVRSSRSPLATLPVWQ